MKWYNQDKTKMIELNCINHYQYVDAKNWLGNNQCSSLRVDYVINGDYLNLTVNGNSITLRGNEATEVYKLVIKE